MASTAASTGRDIFKVGDLVLRVLLFSTTITAVSVMVTSKETKQIQMPIPPFFPSHEQNGQVPTFFRVCVKSHYTSTCDYDRKNKTGFFLWLACGFYLLPPYHFIWTLRYLFVALSVAGLYSIISGIISFLALAKPTSSSVKILAHFLILDVLMLGIVSSATGASGAVAYIASNGNSHLNWGKICNIYDRFCIRLGVSTLISLFASIVLALLVILAAFSVSKKIPR